MAPFSNCSNPTAMRVQIFKKSKMLSSRRALPPLFPKNKGADLSTPLFAFRLFLSLPSYRRNCGLSGLFDDLSYDVIAVRFCFGLVNLCKS